MSKIPILRKTLSPPLQLALSSSGKLSLSASPPATQNPSPSSSSAADISTKTLIKMSPKPVRAMAAPNDAVSLATTTPKLKPKQFVKSQISDSILNDPVLNATVSLLPVNYNFEVHKRVWHMRTQNANRVALQLPEGLLMYSLVLSDIFTSFAGVTHYFILGDVTYGACCIDDLSSAALDADLLIHYGHSCLVPIDMTRVPCIYIFVEIRNDVDRLVKTVELNFDGG